MEETLLHRLHGVWGVQDQRQFPISIFQPVFRPANHCS